MIEDGFSFIILLIDTTFDIMYPLWIFIIAGALASVFLEKIDLLKFCSSNVFLGSLLGIVSPLPTINLIKVLRPSKAAVAMIFSSLLANPILLFLIYINIGLKPMILFALVIFAIGVFFGNIVKYREDVIVTENSLKSSTFLNRFWGYVSYVGFYTVIGAFLAAIMRTLITFTLYNNDIIKFLPNLNIIKTLFVFMSGLFYSCGGMWLPILKELSELGMSFGALIAFILFGQATRMPHLYALKDIFAQKDIINFVFGVGIISLFMGAIFSDVLQKFWFLP